MKSPVRVNDYPNLKEEKDDPGSRKLWLKRVEVRAVLDEANWNSPSTKPYGFVGTRRAWIVRNEITKRYLGPTTEHYPALISSRGREELCGWIERVQKAHAGPPIWRTVRDSDLEMLRPLLQQLAREDIVEVLSRHDGLTTKSVAFLIGIRKRWPNVISDGNSDSASSTPKKLT
jgi:hypothetical protein